MKLKHIAIFTAILTFGILSCKNNSSSFKKLSSGLEYNIVKDNKNGEKATVGSMVTMNIKTMLNDSVLFDSRKSNNNEPVPAQIAPPQYSGDLMEGLVMLKQGDSAIFRIVVDSVFKTGGPQQMPPFMKKGDYVYFYVSVASVKSAEAFEKEEQEKAQQAIGQEEGTIQKFLQENNLKAEKTASGLYYVITQPGSGANAAKGKEVAMKYTGKLLDGTTFDSNVDPKFGHSEPFKFILGQGKVIRGWDEGIALLNKGAKAKLIIPSPLAYGKNAMPGNENNQKGIPANSILTFDVEVLDIADVATK